MLMRHFSGLCLFLCFLHQIRLSDRLGLGFRLRNGHFDCEHPCRLWLQLGICQLCSRYRYRLSQWLLYW